MIFPTNKNINTMIIPWNKLLYLKFIELLLIDELFLCNLFTVYLLSTVFKSKVLKLRNLCFKFNRLFVIVN